jgi:hypothetical protein
MIKVLVIIVLILVVLGLMGVNVKHDVVENQEVHNNVSYVWNGVVNIWNNYLAGPAEFIWQEIFVNILWKAFITNMQRLIDGEPPTDFTTDSEAIPSIPDWLNQYNQDHPLTDQ